MPTNREDLGIYVCPQCKGKLETADRGLECGRCGKTYDLRGEIPDFVLRDLSGSTHPVLRKVRMLDRLAPIYETKLWYSTVLRLAAGKDRISLLQLIGLVQGMVGSVTGRVLDVACGPGTFGRRVASQSREVHGIDISLGMLKRGIVLGQREQVTNIRFARAQVEALPFRSEVFDAAICSGSLHLFADTLLALREISRTLRSGAPLAVVTCTAGSAGLLRYPRVRNFARKKGLRIFEIPELQQILGEAGFKNCRPTTYGSLLTFCAEKC